MSAFDANAKTCLRDLFLSFEIRILIPQTLNLGISFMPLLGSMVASNVKTGVLLVQLLVPLLETVELARLSSVLLLG